MKKVLTVLFSALALSSFADQPFIIILLGPPGAGKGTHAGPLSEKLKIPHISTGELFRENLHNKTPLGEKAQSYMDKGKLVPDELVLDMLFARLALPDCEKGYILDGFPRTIEQAKALESRIPKNAKVVALNFNIPDSLLIERIVNRLVCEDCSAPFHKKFAPPKKPGICDHCGGKLYTRSDDKEATVKTRLKVYHEKSQPVISFYEVKNELYDVNSQKSRNEVFEEVRQTIQAIMLLMKEDAKSKQAARK